MTYYKVVKRVDEQLLSLIHSDPPLGVRYRVGEWAYPNIEGSKLLICNDLGTAKSWAGTFQGLVYECEVKYPSHRGPYVLENNMYANIVYNNLLQMLRLKRKHKRYRYYSEDNNKDSSTMFANAVKLIRQVG